MAVIRKDFLPQDLEPIYNEHGVSGCIAVQADQTLKENDFLLEQAYKHDFIRGVIGWVDLQHPEVEKDIAFYGAMDKMKGFRHVVQGEADPKFILNPNFLRGIQQLQGKDLIYEILVFPHQLPAVYEFVKLFPNIQFILDHIAKPYIADGYFEGWATMIKALGNFENLSCKISGMVTEADYNNWTTEQLMPYMEVVLEAFGPKRILYGSDWPVCLVAASYEEVLSIAKTFARQLSEAEQQQFFHTNAENIYNLQ